MQNGAARLGVKNVSKRVLITCKNCNKKVPRTMFCIMCGKPLTKLGKEITEMYEEKEK